MCFSISKENNLLLPKCAPQTSTSGHCYISITGYFALQQKHLMLCMLANIHTFLF